MGAVLGLGTGVGLVLVAAGLLLPRRTTASSTGARAARLLAAAGLGAVAPRTLVVGCGCLGSVVLLAVQALTATLPVAVAFGLIAGYLPVAALRGRARRRLQEFAEVWPEVVDHLASGVRAGLGLAEALSALAVRGPEPLRPAFSAFAVDHQVSGRLDESLDRLKHLLADPVGDRVVEALRIAREVGGGDLGRLLRNLSVFLREDVRTRSELEARQAWTVNGARLAITAPWLVLVMLSFQHDVIRRYATPAGMLVLTCGGFTCVAAYAAMTRIGRLPTPRRIFG